MKAASNDCFLNENFYSFVLLPTSTYDHKTNSLRIARSRLVSQVITMKITNAYVGYLSHLSHPVNSKKWNVSNSSLTISTSFSSEEEVCDHDHNHIHDENNNRNTNKLINKRPSSTTSRSSAVSSSSSSSLSSRERQRILKQKMARRQETGINLRHLRPKPVHAAEFC